MKREVGLWIDRRKAVIVTIENEVEVTREIRSNIDKHLQHSDASGSKAAKVSKDTARVDSQNKQIEENLGSYYEGILSFIQAADSLLIFGPDKAKHEFEDHVKCGEFRGRVEGIELVGKMSDSQIAAKVRNHFQAY